MAKKMSRKGRELDATAEDWLVSYADMMTGLVLLFILLYVMTAVKAKGMVQQARSEAASAEAQVSAIMESSKENQHKPESEAAASSPPAETETPKSSSASESTAQSQESQKVAIPASTPPPKSSSTKQEMQNLINQHGDLKSVNVVENDEGIKFVIQASVLFDAGTSKLRPESYQMLKELGEYLKTLENNIVISGHTDNIPVNNGSNQSNWELSCDRAVKVLRYLTDNVSVDPTRFVAIGYGEYKPVADNSSDSGRQQNNRVEILVIQK